MKKGMIKIVLASGLMVALQGFGMNAEVNNQQHPGGECSAPMDELAMLRQQMAEMQRKHERELETIKAQKEAAEQAKANLEQNKANKERHDIHESALEFYNARLGKTGLPGSVKLDPVKKLPDVSKIEDRLSDFFSNIETRLPKLTENAKIEDREKSLCEVISIVNDLHTYMDQSLLPLKYACNKVYRNDTMPIVEEKTEVRGPSGEVDVERCRTLPEVITACQEQLTVIDALLQATELALQIEHKKNIFPDSDGCHVVYVEVWNEMSRQEVRLQEIEKRRKDCK